MPKVTLYSDEFGDLVSQALGALAIEDAARICGLSPESVRRMKHGKIPEEATLDKLLRGFPNADKHKIKLAAGYEQPADIVEGVCLALRKSDELSDFAKQQILEFVREQINHVPNTNSKGGGG